MLIYITATVFSLCMLPFTLWNRLTTGLPPALRARLGWSIVVAVLLLIGWALSMLVSSIGMAYPENVRHGYPACASCHVSPGGGGATTPYGRDAAALLSTWKYEGEQDPGFGLVELPEWLMLGGDVRYIDASRWADGQYARRGFVMQRDMEVALRPTRELVIGASAGTYGPDQQPELRRNYVGLTLFDQLTLRGGRFVPAYGINFPDHTLPTRAGLGLGQGQESYNTEASYVGPYGETIFTAIYGRATNVLGSSRSGYGVATDSLSGFAGRSAVFVGDRAQLGLSFLNLASQQQYRQAFGAHALVGFTASLYLAAEYDKRFEAGATADVAYGKLGLEVVQGLHVFGTGQTLGTERGGGAGIQWFPRPHIEVLGEWKRLFIEQRYTDGANLLLHYYL